MGTVVDQNPVRLAVVLFQRIGEREEILEEIFIIIISKLKRHNGKDR